jgi:hypothetical protein
VFLVPRNGTLIIYSNAPVSEKSHAWNWESVLLITLHRTEQKLLSRQLCGHACLLEIFRPLPWKGNKRRLSFLSSIVST